VFLEEEQFVNKINLNFDVNLNSTSTVHDAIFRTEQTLNIVLNV
jgi:hypothetical protein